MQALCARKGNTGRSISGPPRIESDLCECLTSSLLLRHRSSVSFGIWNVHLDMPPKNVRAFRICISQNGTCSIIASEHQEMAN